VADDDECPNGATVIASQRVGAKRRPMTGSAKQSIAQQGWIASSLALLAMTAADAAGPILHLSISHPRCALCLIDNQTTPMG
jgi:hypothetical protein